VISHSLHLFRPAIEVALGVAKQGEMGDPVVPAPAALRPFLAFAKLPPAALAVARRVVDDDPDFRCRVRDATSESEVGAAGWLWLERPEGWEQALTELEESAPAGGQREDREHKREARRQAAAEAMASRLEQRAHRAQEELERVKQESAELRRANRQLALELERTESQVVKLTEERMQAVRQLKGVEATLAERSAEARRHREDLERLRAEFVASETRAAAAIAEAAGLPPPPLSSAPTVAAGVGGVDLGRASRTVTVASLAAERLAGALSELAGLLAPAVRDVTEVDAEEDEGGAVDRPALRRRAVRLPRGAVDDTPQAAAYLARLPGVGFVIDGYNVSKTAWPELELSAQRLRLVNAVAELRARLGTSIELVFDGADEGRVATRALPSSVRVWFSPESVEADDLILSLVDTHAATRPIVVVSSDRRVKDGARQRGASVLSSKTFLTLLR
jgi:hypothetical protein